MSRTVISKPHRTGPARTATIVYSAHAVKHLIQRRSTTVRLASRARGIPASIIAILLAGLPLASCAGPEPTSKTGPNAPIQSTLVTGDWDDVQVAADLGATRGRVAPLNEIAGKLEDGRKTMTFVLLATDDRQFLLIATQAEPGSGETKSGPIDLVVRGNPYRDAAREKAILDGAASRLKQLAGKDWAPIR